MPSLRFDAQTPLYSSDAQAWRMEQFAELMDRLARIRIRQVVLRTRKMSYDEAAEHKPKRRATTKFDDKPPYKPAGKFEDRPPRKAAGKFEDKPPRKTTAKFEDKPPRKFAGERPARKTTSDFAARKPVRKTRDR